MLDSRDNQLPDSPACRLLVLKALQDGGQYSRVGICQYVADTENLSKIQRAQKYPGGENVLLVRVHWALYGLRHAGLVDRPKRGIYQITEEGKRFLGKMLTSGLSRIREKSLLECPKYKAWRQELQPDVSRATPSEVRVVSDVPEAGEGLDASEAGEEADDLSTPKDRLESARADIQRHAEEEIRERLQSVESDSFEKIVIDLLLKMGYGRSRADWSEVTGGPGDGGIDGVIKEDALGLGKIYMQAKRYNEASAIGPSVVQQFVGALAGKGVAKGVFVTTSGFTKAAREYADKQNNIVWVDGEEFARLMIQYRVGVVCGEPIYVVEKIDENYFSEED